MIFKWIHLKMIWNVSFWIHLNRTILTYLIRISNVIMTNFNLNMGDLQTLNLAAILISCKKEHIDQLISNAQICFNLELFIKLKKNKNHFFFVFWIDAIAIFKFYFLLRYTWQKEYRPYCTWWLLTVWTFVQLVYLVD